MKILLVEDSIISQKIFRQAVKRLDIDEQDQIDINIVSGVAKAVEILHEGYRPDIIFLDWKLEDGTGEALLEWIRSREAPDWRCYLTVHVLSSSGSQSDIQLALKANSMANAYLVKPSGLSALTEIIKASLLLVRQMQKI